MSKEQPVQCSATLRAALQSALGCICAFQHIANPDRASIQQEIDAIKHVLACVPMREISKEPLEFRMDDEGELDEVVGACDIHMERMSANTFWLGIYRPGSNDRAAISLHLKNKTIHATITEKMPLTIKSDIESEATHE